MRLETWRRRQGITQQELARQLEVAHTTVGRWLSGRARIPNRENLRRIVELTKGAVTGADFVDEIDEAA